MVAELTQTFNRVQQRPVAESVSLITERLDRTHEVADFEEWKRGFDNHEDARRGAGILGHHINRDRGNPNRLSIYCALSDIDKAREFTASDDLRETMEKVGVISPPEIRWMTPLREAVVWDRELPAFMLAHSVSNVDEWLPQDGRSRRYLGPRRADGHRRLGQAVLTRSGRHHRTSRRR